ncbi:MAG TPA: type II secretion system F family protein, partial [Chthonomonadaceae bacterium]|nr:type II secretion system F family protein [Chthonomonadaceae bacterium]
MARASQRAMREADRGMMPSVALGATGQFPPMAMDMLRTGEMSGALDDMMEKVADFQEAEAKVKSHQAAIIFSVIVLLLVALVVLHVLMMFWGGYSAGLSQAANS